MMNIQRYKWPVLVAAGLHGALFLSTPHSSIGGTTKPPVVRGPEEPVAPEEPMIQVSEIDADTSPDAPPARGAAAVPELPDVIVPLVDNRVFTTPVVEPHSAEKLDHTLKEHSGGPVGPFSGPLISSGSASWGVDKLDRKPRATSQISPDYPSTMHQQGIAGSVTVEFDVNAEGRVVRAGVVHASRREFEEPALRAVRNWRFESGKRNGRPVAFRMTVPIEFLVDAN